MLKRFTVCERAILTFLHEAAGPQTWYKIWEGLKQKNAKLVAKPLLPVLAKLVYHGLLQRTTDESAYCLCVEGWLECCNKFKGKRRASKTKRKAGV
jgi:hypothetical protein